jgi:hypothetical protein
MDKFTQLVKDLDEGELTLLHLQNAYREHIRHNKYIPDEAKGLLCGEGRQNPGLIAKQFNLISQGVGLTELLARRLGWKINKNRKGKLKNVRTNTEKS